MNQFDVIDAKSPLRGISYLKYWDLSSKFGILELNLIGSDPTMGNLDMVAGCMGRTALSRQAVCHWRLLQEYSPMVPAGRERK